MKVLGVIMGALFVVFLGTAAAAPPADISMTEEWYLIQSQPDVDKQEGNVYVTEGMLFEDPIESTKEWYLLDQEVTAGEVSKKFSKAPEMNEALQPLPAERGAGTQRGSVVCFEVHEVIR